LKNALKVIKSLLNEILNLAEHVAKVYNVSREEQDKFAFSSQVKYKNAVLTNCFKDEIGIFLNDQKISDFEFIF